MGWPSRNHFCRGKAIIITYCEGVYPYLSNKQSECAVLYTYCQLWPVWFYHIFPHYHI